MTQTKQQVSIMWFRRDLRLEDNAALYHALRAGYPVLPLFIFDRNILDDLEDRQDRRVQFIHASLHAMQAALERSGASLMAVSGTPLEVFEKLSRTYDIQSVWCNQDYEQYAIDRDRSIANFLSLTHVKFHACKDQVIFHQDEIVKDDGSPYQVFTPYSRKWKAKLDPASLKPYPSEQYLGNFLSLQARIPTLESLGFLGGAKDFPADHWPDDAVRQYDQSRDYPARAGTSRLGVHLRFGTVSIRKWVTAAQELNGTFLNELIWREFYQMILWHFPHVRKGASFRQEYDRIQWRNDVGEFAAWCQGKTGYPLVDAGMRELNETGFMHNRVRMITASFLTRHLLIDWRWGEAYFAKKLLDYDYAANNGGWQWAAGTGCDAVPYFRIFNPARQALKFDPDVTYIRRWVPELDSFDYPPPIVDHEMAWQRALRVYREALKGL